MVIVSGTYSERGHMGQGSPSNSSSNVLFFSCFEAILNLQLSFSKHRGEPGAHGDRQRLVSRPVFINLWVATPLWSGTIFSQGCLRLLESIDIYIAINSSSKITVLQQNKVATKIILWLGGPHNMRNWIKDHSIRKVESHCCG